MTNAAKAKRTQDQTNTHSMSRRHCLLPASITLLVLLSLLHPSQAFAANPDLETVLTGSRQRIQKLDYRMSGRLTRVEADGKRTNYKFVAKAHWFPDGL